MCGDLLLTRFHVMTKKMSFQPAILTGTLGDGIQSVGDLLRDWRANYQKLVHRNEFSVLAFGVWRLAL